MEELRVYAKNMQLISTLIVGSTFAIFLTLGDVWSQFLQITVHNILPNDYDNESMLYGVVLVTSTSIISMLFLIILVNLQRCIDSIKMEDIKQKIIIKKDIRSRARLPPRKK